MQKAGKWREVWALSLPIIQDSSVERITGRVKVRTKDKNANAGRLRRKGKADRTESPASVGYSVTMLMS